MRRFLLFIMAVCVVATAGSANAVTVDTEIDRVVVFRDRAEVTRIGTVELEPGEHKLVFERLVGGLMADSLRIAAQGTVEALIGGLDIEPVFLEESAEERTRSLLAQIRDLDDNLRRIKDEAGVLQRQMAFIESIKAQKAAEIGKELTTAKPDVEDWQALVDFLGKNFSEIARKRFDGEIRQRDVSAKLNKLRAELNQVQSRAGTRLWNVAAAVTMPAAGTIDVALTYVVRGASWTPIYNARYMEADKSVELDYHARVRQSTGEDWTDAAVALSTAEPQVGAQIPELRQWNLSFSRPVMVGRRAGGMGGMARLEMAEDTRAAVIMDELQLAPPAASAPLQKAKQIAALPESRGTLVQFAVPGRQSIPADNREHRVTVVQTTLTGDAEYVSVPKRAPHAYLRTKVTNNLDAPLLAGPVNVFVGPNFTGQSRIKTIALEEEFDLSFGVDEGVKVTRDEMENERSDAGVINQRTRWTRKYKFTVANHKTQVQTVVIIDQMPMSQDEDIIVQTAGTSLQPTEKDDKGIVKWKIELKPTEKKEFTFGYVVEYPKGRMVPGFGN